MFYYQCGSRCALEGCIRIDSRFLTTAILLMIAGVAPVAAQSLGGCTAGTEMGYVTVQEQGQLRFWDNNEPFMAIQPGDELRLCRYEGNNAIVTLNSWGLGFQIPRQILSPQHSRSDDRQLTSREESCLIFHWDRIVRNYQSIEQNRHFLQLAREWRVTLSQLYDVQRTVLELVMQNRMPTGCPPVGS